MRKNGSTDQGRQFTIIMNGKFGVILLTALCLISSLLVIPGALAQDPVSQTFTVQAACSIVGNWRVVGYDATYVVNNDGSIQLRFDSGEAPKVGTWTQNQDFQYTFYWTHSPGPGQPNYVDAVIMSSDCQRLDITNNFGDSVTANRITACNIVGSWRVVGYDATYVVNNDGSIQLRFDSGEAPKVGTWTQNQDFQYTFYWTHSPGPGQPNYVDTVVMSFDCQRLDITNNFGDTATANRILNQPPVASFKSYNIVEEVPQEGPHMAGGKILFDATESYDPDASLNALNKGIKEYHWEFGDGTAPMVTTNSTCEKTFIDPEIYIVNLIVIDQQDVPSEKISEPLDLSLLPGDLTFIRTGPPYSTIFNWLDLKYTHVGMYVGKINGIHYMIESVGGKPPLSKGKGVILTRFNRWAYPYEQYADVVRVNLNGQDPDIPNKAVAWAMSKLNGNHDYDLDSIRHNLKQLDENDPNLPLIQNDYKKAEIKKMTRNYYCSELVWAAYYRASNGGIDLSNVYGTGPEIAIPPDGIIGKYLRNPLIQQLAWHHEHYPN